MRTIKALSLAAGILALAACNSTTAPPVEEPDFALSGTVLNVGEVPMPNTVTLTALHPDIYDPVPLRLAPAATDYDGTLLGIATGSLSEDGDFEWDLGDGSDIPAAYMVVASQAFETPDFSEDITCSSTASATVKVLKSFVMEGGVITPIGIVGPLSDLGASGDGVLVYADIETLDPPPPGPFQMKTWVYADGDVSITGGCERDDGMNPVTEVSSFDVDLVAGWNVVSVLVDQDAGTSTVTNEDFEGNWLFLPGVL